MIIFDGELKLKRELEFTLCACSYGRGQAEFGKQTDGL
jgi:hypothetical protein